MFIMKYNKSRFPYFFSSDFVFMFMNINCVKIHVWCHCDTNGLKFDRSEGFLKLFVVPRNFIFTNQILL